MTLLKNKNINIRLKKKNTDGSSDKELSYHHETYL